MNKDILSKRILFGGYYGMDNVGDDCFGVISTWGAIKYWNSKEVFILSKKNIDGPIKTYSCLKGKTLFKGQVICESFFQIMRASCVVWSGGSIFHSKVPFYNQRQISYFASNNGITPAGAIGVSLGPYKSLSDQNSIHNYLKKLNFLILRDNVSYEEACSINLPYKPILSADMAMLLPKIFPEFKHSDLKHKILGVTVCHYERYANKSRCVETRREILLLNALKNLVRNGFTGVLRFFIFNSNSINGDQEITEEFCDKLKDEGVKIELVFYSTDPISIWMKIAECTAMISIRLHGAIFAAAADVPCLLIEYHRKCTDFINDIGIDDKWKIGDINISSKNLSIKIMEILEFDDNYYKKRDKIINLANKNFTFIDDLS